MNKIVAKRSTNGEKLMLDEHIKQSLTVMDVFLEYFGNFLNKEKGEYLLAKRAICLHDFGKSCAAWQNAINSETRPTFQHSAISSSFLWHYLNENEFTSSVIKDIFIAAIAFHHPWYYDTTTDSEDTTESVLRDILAEEDYDNLYKLLIEINKTYDLKFQSINSEGQYTAKKLCDFKMYFEEMMGRFPNRKISYLATYKNESLFNRIHSLVVYCDRVASELWANNRFTKENIRKEIEKSYKISVNYDYDKIIDLLRNNEETNQTRLNEQVRIANSNKQFLLLNHPCGNGKTLSNILSILKTHTKAIIVVATRNLVDTTFDNIRKNLEFINCDELNDIKIARYYKGEYQKDNCEHPEDADIIIATIDAFYKEAYENDKLKNKITLFTKFVVFDEMHEFTNQVGNSIPKLFYTTLQTRYDANANKTILSSATAPMLIKNWEYAKVINIGDNFEMFGNDIKPYNQQHLIYFSKLIDANKNNEVVRDLLSNGLSEDGYILCTPTIEINQEFSNYINDSKTHTFKNNLITVNSTIEDSTRNERRKRVITANSKDNISKNNNVFCVDTNYFTQAVDITVKKFADCICTPTRFLQTIGRINRIDTTEVLKAKYVAYTSKNIRKTIKTRILSNEDNNIINNYVDVWEKYYIDNFADKTLSIGEVYELYNKFESEYKDIIIKYESFLLNESNSAFKANSGLFIRKRSCKNGNETYITLSSKEGIRGENSTVFVRIPRQNEGEVVVSLDANKFIYDRRNRNLIDTNARINPKDTLGYLKNNKNRFFNQENENKYRYFNSFLEKLSSNNASEVIRLAKYECTPVKIYNCYYDDNVGVIRRR